MNWRNKKPRYKAAWFKRLLTSENSKPDCVTYVVVPNSQGGYFTRVEDLANSAPGLMILHTTSTRYTYGEVLKLSHTHDLFDVKLYPTLHELVSEKFVDLL